MADLKRDNQNFSASAALRILGGILVVWLFLLHSAQGNASAAVILLASISYFLTMLPFFVYLIGRRDTLCIFPLYGLNCFIAYVYPIFSGAGIGWEIEETYLIKALFLFILGFSAMLFAFYTPLGGISNLFLKPKYIEIDEKKLLPVAFISIAVGIVLPQTLSMATGELLFSVFRFLGFLGTLGIALFLLRYFEGKMSFAGKLFLFGILLPYVFVKHLISGATAGVLFLLVLIILVYIYVRKTIPWLHLILAGILFFVIFSARDDFRYLTKIYPDLYNTTSKRAMLYLQLINERITGKTSDYGRTRLALAERTNFLSLFAYTIKLTPRYIPYWDGYTYKDFIYSFLPRVLFPDKPKKVIGQEFGHRYNLLAYEDTSTSINLPQLVEMYINFGTLGVIIGMFFIGLIHRALNILFNHPSAYSGGVIIYLALYGELIEIGSDFSLVYGNFLQAIIFLYIFLRVSGVFKLVTAKPGYLNENTRT